MSNEMSHNEATKAIRTAKRALERADGVHATISAAQLETIIQAAEHYQERLQLPNNTEYLNMDARARHRTLMAMQSLLQGEVLAIRRRMDSEHPIVDGEEMIETLNAAARQCFIRAMMYYPAN